MRLDVEADHLHLARTVRVKPKDASGVVLRPELGVRIDVQLVREDGGSVPWELASAVVLSKVGSAAFRVWDSSASRPLGEDLRAEFRGLRAADNYEIRIVPPEGVEVMGPEVQVSPGMTREVEVSVWRSAHIFGRVVDEVGDAIPNAHLELVIRKGNTSKHHYGRATPDGVFDIDAIPPSSLSLSIEAPGFVPRRWNLGQVAAGEERDLGPLVLSGGNRVTVEVVGADGRRAEGVTISLEGPGEWRTVSTPSLRDGVRWSDNGSTVYTGLGKGPFAVSAWTGASPRSLGVLEGVQPNTTARVVLVDPVRTTGRVVDHDGQPIAAYLLEYRPVGRRSPLYPYSSESFTDGEGRFALDLQPGRWLLEVSHKGYGTLEIEVPATHPITITAQRGATYSGIVIDAAGRSVPGAMVLAGYRESPNSDVQVNGQAGPDGAWSFDLPPGKVWFEAHERSLRGARVYSRGEPGEVVEGVVLMLESRVPR